MKLTYLKTLSVLLFISFACGAQAQIYVNASATGNNNGSSWADAFTDLQDGLDASTAGGSTEIWVAAATYKPGEAAPAVTNAFTFPADLQLYGGFNGTESTLAERDFAANETVLSADFAGDDVVGNFGANRDENARNVIFLTDTITTATVISGFTIRSGNTMGSDGTGDERRGGGILSYGAPTIDNCLFTDNYGFFGGGLYPRGDGANGFSATDCQFIGNSGGSGAGIYILGAGNVTRCTFADNSVTSRGGACYVNNRTVTFEDCTFSDNSASSSTGGAIHFRSDDVNSMAINNGTFNNNSASWGGAVNTYDETSTTIITDCSFAGNTSSARGGAVYMGFKARTEVHNSVFTDNTTEGGGGAISAQNDTTSLLVSSCDFMSNGEVDGFDISGGAIGVFGGIDFVVENSFFESNTADFGGAITIAEDSVDVTTFVARNSVFRLNTASTQAAGINIAGAETLIENCLIAFNLCNDGTGGGLSINSADSLPTNVTILNSTIVDNVASLGAGIATWTNEAMAPLNVDLQNTAISNIAGNNYEIEAGTPTVTSLGGNLSDDNTLDAAFIATDISGQDPLFVSSSALDYRLLEGSPCIDAAIDAAAPLTDLAGNTRIGVADIGCYEFDPTISTTQVSPLGKVVLFPNPVKDQFTFVLESEYNGSLQVHINDRAGKLIQAVQLEKMEKEIAQLIDVNDLSSGQYFLNITNGDKNIAVPFVKI